MTIVKQRIKVFFICFFLIATCMIGTAEAELVNNGSFESGDFTGWTVFDEPGSGGTFFVVEGTTTPISNHTVLPPPDGSYAAVSDEDNPTSCILYQDVSIPDNVTADFSATVYVNNYATDYFVAADLSHAASPNQQMRVDIMDPAFPVDDIGAGVLINLFQTNPGDPLLIGYTTLTADLTPYAGSTIRIRIVQVDTEFFLNAAVDAVSIVASDTIPTLNEWGMIIFSLLMAGSAFWFIRKGSCKNC